MAQVDLDNLYHYNSPITWIRILRYPAMVCTALAVAYFLRDFNTTTSLVAAAFCVANAWVIGAIDTDFERGQKREGYMLQAARVCVVIACASAVLALLHLAFPPLL